MGESGNMMYIKDIWGIFENTGVRNLRQLTEEIENMRENGYNEEFPEGFNFLVDFEAMIRSHIYAEWHAQEYVDGVDTE